jgi:hypothetical protein
MGPVKRPTRVAEKKPPPPPPMRKHHCFRCQTDFARPETNFFKAQSSLYRGNCGYIHICKSCVNELFDHYFDAIGDGRQAMLRLCEKLDLYWSEVIWASVCTKTNTAQSRAAAYFRQANLRQYEGKTFDDWHDESAAALLAQAQTLEEERVALDALRTQVEEEQATASAALEEAQSLEAEAIDMMKQAKSLQEQTPIEDDEPAGPSPEQLSRWGAELPAWYYDEADRIYSNWDAKLDPAIDRNDAANWGILKQICLAEAQINEAISRGKQSDVARLQGTYNTLIGSASLKPGQRKEDAARTDLEGLPLGVLAKVHEGIRPIEDVAPELEDIDALRRTHFAMFLGGLAKMFKMRNKYADMFDAEFARYTAKAPERSPEDDDDGAAESLMAKMFGGDPDG